MEKIEYRVRPVARYVVTRYEEGEGLQGKLPAHSRVMGEYGNAEMAYEVGYALCKADHDRLGWPAGDERIQYPQMVQPPAPELPCFQSLHGIGARITMIYLAGGAAPGKVVGVRFITGKVLYDIDLDQGGETLRDIDSTFVDVN